MDPVLQLGCNTDAFLQGEPHVDCPLPSLSVPPASTPQHSKETAANLSIQYAQTLIHTLPNPLPGTAGTERTWDRSPCHINPFYSSLRRASRGSSCSDTKWCEVYL
ncbi:hypothetical protein FKM82_005628 [Ascaphus truei]